MTDVLIVGAGVVGLFCAARLARMGARVTLLEAEAEDFGGHGPAASLAAAGMLAPISESHLEPGEHPRLTQLGLESFQLWRDWSAEAAYWADGVRFDGAAVLARDTAHADAILARAAALGRKAAPLPAGQWKKRTGLEARTAHALFVEDEAVADPQRVLSGLVMELHYRGARVLFNHDVEAVTANEARIWDGPTFNADHVLLCPGAWASDNLIAAAPPLKHLRPANGVMVPVATGGELRANIRGHGFYLARRRGDDVVLGSTMQFDSFSRAPDPESVASLFAAADAALPGQVRPHAEARPWAGVRPMSPDWAPMIGKCETGVLIAAGHSRNGWLLAPITAEIVCAHVFGRAVPDLWSAFSPDRFNP
jgi:glycine oxidase